MSIFLSYSRLLSLYVDKMEYTHEVGAVEYSLYATEQRPGGDLRQTAEALLQNGANPTLVDNYLNQHSVPVKPRDVYKIIQKHCGECINNSSIDLVPATPIVASTTWH